MADTPPPPPVPPTGPPAPPPSYGDGPPPQPRGGRGSIWVGIGLGAAFIALLWASTIALSNTDRFEAVVLLWLGMPLIMLIAGIVLVVIPRTTRTGAGVLISMGAAVLIGGGVCVALLTVPMA
ncbi:hypothetical protein GCM10022200_08310 [Microbacterium awajiense]|uniref:Uncharacterized protein n=1 Tax=Microbacterium awajiense TaxID=415214 RepID=A0ABP7AAS0_9MICO